MNLYVETSALLRAILEQDMRVAKVIDGASSEDVVFTSALTIAEAERGARRALLKGRLTPVQHRELQQRIREFEAGCDLLAVDSNVLRRAGEPFAHEPVRTLDGIQLATALSWAEKIGEVHVLTCDQRVSDNVLEYGLTLVELEPSRPRK